MSKEQTSQNKGLHIGLQAKGYINTKIMLGIILLVGIGLRFFNLGAESYWIDEMSTVIEGQQSVQQLFVSGRLDQPPAYYIPFHLWMQLFGDSEISTRLFSALIGIGSIVLVYVIGKMLFGNEIGLLAAFLMAISEFGIYHSQIARFYSFFEFLTLLSFLFFILMIRNQKLIYIALYTIACILLVYSHTYGIFVLVAQNLFFFLQVGRNRNFITTWLISQILIGLALSPYLFPLLFGEGGVKGAVDLNLGGKPAPTLLDPFHTVYRFIITGRRGRSLASFLATYAAAGVFFVGGTWLHAIRKGKSRFLDETKGWFAGLQESPDIRGKFLLLSFWFLCPILLPFIASLVFAPMYDDHFTISAAPAFYLLLAVGIFSIRKIVPIIISLGALAIIVVPGMFNYYAQDIHEQWREVAAYVEGNAESDDVIIFAPNTGIGIQQKTFDWYYPGTLKSCGLVNSKLIDSKAISDAVMQCVSGRNRFWVVIANYSNVTDDERFKSFFLNSNQAIFHKIMEQQFVGLSVYLFELAQ